MAKLSGSGRAKLPGKVFAGPGRSFPVEDKAHAEAALRLVGRAQRAGHITSAQAAAIRGMARKKLGK
jgi:hypothetical protein